MSVSHTNITTGNVRTELGADNNNVGQLCTDSNINKWSQGKPVEEKNSNTIYWYRTPDDDCSLTYTYRSLDIWIYTFDSGWTYRPPTGGVSSSYRLTDFRGYNQSAVPFVYTDDYPTGTWSINDIDASFGYETNLIGSNGFTATDIGLEDYYYGVFLEWSDGGTYNKRAIQTDDFPIGGAGVTRIDVDMSSSVFGNSDGTFRWSSFVTDVSQASLVDIEDLAETPAEFALIYSTPEFDSYINQGTFDLEILRYFTLSKFANFIGTPYFQEDVVEAEVTITNDGDATDTQNVDGWWQKWNGSSWVGIEPAGPISYGPLAVSGSTTKSFYYTSSVGDSGSWRLYIAPQYGNGPSLTYSFTIT